MIKTFLWVGLIILFLSACSGGQLPPSPTASSEPEQGIANVKQIEILKLATEPVQVRVSAQVELPDACTTIDKVSTQKVADAFQVTITILRSGDQACPQTPLLVDRLIPLDVTGMPPGVYTVAVNNLGGRFELEDQISPTTSVVNPEPPAASSPISAPSPVQPSPQDQTATDSSAPTEPSPTPTAPNCAEKIAFFEDVTVLDGTFFRQGERFTKTWKLRNEGTCTWDQDYALVYAGGELLNTPLTNPLSEEIAPGEIFTVSLEMTAPSEGGTYVSKWLFQNPHGEQFGLGVGGHDVLYAKIQVGWVDPFDSSVGSAGGSPGSAISCGERRDPAFESQVLALINAVRIQNGLRQLALQDQLTAAALGHSADMACNNFTSHTGSDGSSWDDRISAQGYAHAYANEIIYYGSGDGFGDPQTALDWWWKSPTHHDILLSPDATEIGIGYVYYADSKYGGYYTAVFAKP